MNISEHCSQVSLAHMYLRSAENNVVSASKPSGLIYMPLTNAVLCLSLVSAMNFIKIHLLLKLLLKTALILKPPHCDNPFTTYPSVPYINMCGTSTFTIHSYRGKLVLFFSFRFLGRQIPKY